MRNSNSNRPSTHEGIRATMPRLLRAMKWAAILSESEAIGALQLWRQQRDPWAGEAVCHFGGTESVIAVAWRGRHYVRRMYTAQA